MKVVHFSPIYIDGWGYQDNLLPLYFKELGHETTVITLTRLPNYIKQKKKMLSKYIIDGVEVRRIKPQLYIAFNLFFVKNLYKNLEEIKPDIIFHHGISFTSLATIVAYKKKNPNCKIFIDSHSDIYNCTTPRFWYMFYYKTILKLLTKMSMPYINKFYGVSPGRCDFLEKTYNINPEKIKLLPIGADTLTADSIKLTKEFLRIKYNLPQTAFVITSGGKMGKDKGTDMLIEIVNELNSTSKNVQLILFGSFNDRETELLATKSKSIITIGWCDRETTFELLKLADVAIWPIHHTSLIEDCIAILTPLIIKKTRTTEHLIENNGFFLGNGSKDEIKLAIETLKKLDKNKLNEDCLKMRLTLDYKTIVKTVINDSNFNENETNND